MVGRTLRHYRIEEQLGAGGMGVVYRATDTKLGRQVAIKVLPEDLARHPERLARFKREAQLLASLNHPNIAAIYGLEEADGVCFLVLELVPGETLAQRLSGSAISVPEALGICRQIAEAAEEAHEKGIMHRDLKPANVKVTPEGKVKVLDFGLAKAFWAESESVDLSQSPTVTAEPTREGVVLGTAAYMSPEQARGKRVDKRTDIWSFGCVLYETLARRKTFRGETITDCIAAILGTEPDWQALPEATPPNIQVLLRRCLQKDPQRRLRDIGDARLELEEALAEPAKVAVAILPTGARPGLRLALYAAACLVSAALAAAALAWSMWRKTPPPAPPVARFAVTLPPKQLLHPTGGSSAVISPDGTKIVYVANQGDRTQLYLRPLGELEAKPIPGATGAVGPFFSRDGQWVGFRQLPSRMLRKVALSGGAPVTLCPAEAYGGGAWLSSDTVLFSTYYPGGLFRVPAAGGSSQAATTLDLKKEERTHRSPQPLPGGKAVLFTIAGGGMESYDDARIAVQSLETGERRTLIEGGTSANYSPSGHLLYARGGTLLAVPFDLKRLAVTGSPAPVLEGVFMSTNTGTAHYSLSDNGTLVYAPGAPVGGERLPVWVDRQGKAQSLPLPPRPYLHPRIAPDGRQVAIEIEGPNHDFWLYEIARGTMTKLTTDGLSHWPVWTPDGRRLAFRSWRTGTFTLWWMPADRSGPEERLTHIGSMQSPSSWSPDGRAVAFTQHEANSETAPDVWVLDREGDRKPRPFAQTKFSEGSPKFSPDGRWIAYCSNESGRMEVYVQPYPGPGPKIQISSDGGSDPVWKHKGGELFYRNGEKMMAVAVTTHPRFTALKPRLLWEGRYAHGFSSICGAPGPTSSNYDVTADGQRFLMIKEEERAPSEIHVVLNWSEELKRLTQSKK